MLIMILSLISIFWSWRMPKAGGIVMSELRSLSARWLNSKSR